MATFDYLLVGGGLQNALIASALAARQPQSRVALVESVARVGGNHTWCFHADDIQAPERVFVEPFVVQRFASYDVHFPELSRSLPEQYAAVSSDALHEVVSGLAGTGKLELRLGARAVRIEPGRVELASGEVLDARVVIDSRGPDRFERELAVGFQKFVGLELEIEAGTGPTVPTLMDARVPQVDGFRFFYVLPFATDRLLVEDTYFSDGPELDEAALREGIFAYAKASGIRVKSVIRQEKGVLPLPAQMSERPQIQPGLLHGGYQGGWFHPTTGYSFPLAVRFASTVARVPIDALCQGVKALAAREARQQRYATLLNRMLFQGFAPEQRYHVLERFYRLPAPTVRRFYALTLTSGDRARILCGRPPRGLSLHGFLSALGAPRATSRALKGTTA
jgi:lycopene beta-cyclase